jgi:hypothetical protein
VHDGRAVRAGVERTGVRQCDRGEEMNVAFGQRACDGVFDVFPRGVDVGA